MLVYFGTGPNADSRASFVDARLSHEDPAMGKPVAACLDQPRLPRGRPRQTIFNLLPEEFIQRLEKHLVGPGSGMNPVKMTGAFEYHRDGTGQLRLLRRNDSIDIPL